jgi:hypothetical protein
MHNESPVKFSNPSTLNENEYIGKRKKAPQLAIKCRETLQQPKKVPGTRQHGASDFVPAIVRASSKPPYFLSTAT